MMDRIVRKIDAWWFVYGPPITTLFWGFCLMSFMLMLFLGCTERVVDNEGVEREIESADVRARVVEVLEQREEDVASTCSCSYHGYCHECGPRLTNEGIKHGCGWGFQKCSGHQSCDKHEKIQVVRERITLNTGVVVFSYPREVRQTMSKRVTGNCE